MEGGSGGKKSLLPLYDINRRFPRPFRYTAVKKVTGIVRGKITASLSYVPPTTVYSISHMSTEPIEGGGRTGTGPW